MDNRVELILSKLKGKVLDVGFYCGTLHNEIKKKVKEKDLYGLDTDIKKGGGNYKKGSAEKIPFKETFFDTVVAGELIEHLHKPESFVKEAGRVLKKNGLLIISTPNRESLINRLARSYYTEVHKSLFNFKELEELLKKKGFAVRELHFFPYTEESSDGAKHKQLFFLRKQLHKFLPTSLQEEMVFVAEKK